MAAPVEAKAAVASAAEARPGFYTVKKGDTLYSIALDHGQTYRDLAAWNGIDDPNRIQIGQQLRVTPPESPAPVAVTKPIAAPAAIEVRPIGEAPANSDGLKREPKGGKQPYSAEALAKLQQGDAAPVRVVASESRAPQKAPEKPAETPPEVRAAAGDPVDWTWPAGGKLLGNFVEGSNKGIDIAGKTGDAVTAASAGKIVYVGTGIRGYGKMVIIKHSPSFLTVYAHNSQVMVKEEQMVGTGQKIAEIGNSDADQPKLHFEIRHMNKPVDPLKYLPAR